MTAAILLLLTSLAGIAGLRWGNPRPNIQEGWAILAITPLFLLVSYAFLFGALR